MQINHPDEDETGNCQRQHVRHQQHQRFRICRTHGLNLRLRPSGAIEILATIFRQPVEIFFIPRAQGQNQKLRRVVRMPGENQFFQRGQLGLLRFKDQQNFRSRFNLSLPPVMRFDFRNQIRAGDQTRLQRSLGERASRFQIRRCDENDGEFCGGFQFVKLDNRSKP